MMPTEFTMTDEHVKLLRASFVEDEHSTYETGAAWINPKRPYGNSYVAGDVIELLEMGQPNEDGEYPEELEEVALAIHRETQVALQIILTTGAFEPGAYRRTDRYDNRSWVRVP